MSWVQTADVIIEEQRQKDRTFASASRFFTLYAILFPEIKAWDMYISDIHRFCRRWYAKRTFSKNDVR